MRMASPGFVHVVDDDTPVRESLGDLFGGGSTARNTSTGDDDDTTKPSTLDAILKVLPKVLDAGAASEFLNVKLSDAPACLVLDVRLPGTSGLELQQSLTRLGIGLPVILMTGFGDIPMSVKGMKAGAIDFLTKPIRDQDLLDAVASAVRVDQNRRQETAELGELQRRYDLLTPRERQVTALVASGLMNKQVAHELSISEVTVKVHRGSAMRKLKAGSVARLARIAEILNIVK